MTRRRTERETDAEIHLHLAQRVEDLVAEGMSRPAAEEEALRRFGPFDSARADLHAAARHRDRVLTMIDRIDALRHDVGDALRQIRRAPALAIAVTATFALGVGANATMFGLLDRLLLLAPPHVAAPEELVRVRTSYLRGDGSIAPSSSYSYPGYVAVRDNVSGFESVAMQTYPDQVSLGLGAGARAIQYVLVSGNYFQTLGTHTQLGRPILPADDRLPNGSPVVVIGDGLWRREFGGESSAIGTTITLAGRRYTIVGVAPRDFLGTGTRPVDVWIPVSVAGGLRFAGEDWVTNRFWSWLTLVARLKRGVSPSLAGEQVAAAMRVYREAGTGKRDTTTRAVVQESVLPTRQTTVSSERRVALLLGGVSVLVLLIACANVANLLLARALKRRREIAVRLALGISRGRLIRQLVVEGVVLAVMGGVAALVVVRFGSLVVYKALFADSALPSNFVNLRVLGFTLVAAVVVGLLAAVVPALQTSRPNLARDLKEGTRGAGLSRSRTRVALLLAQAALSVVMLAGTGLFVRSLRNVTHVSLGVDIDKLVIGAIDLRSVGIDSARGAEYFRQAAIEAGRLPGVASAAVAQAAPFSDWSNGSGVKIPGRDSVPQFENGPYKHGITEKYFSTVGTRIVQGRALDASDMQPGSEPVIVINESAARTLWPTETAIGKCIQFALKKNPPCARIVGVAEDTHNSEILEKGSRMQIYHPLGAEGLDPRECALIVRATGDPGTLVEPLRRVMQTVWSGLPSANVRPMNTMLDAELRPWRLGATLFGAFGAIALVLAALGLYSVVAYSAAQRKHEIGVRVALGAGGWDIAWLVLSQGLGMAAAGIVIGTALALAAGRLIGSLLYDESPRDPAVFIGVAVVLFVVATMASVVPALKAKRATPLDALRAE